MNKINQKKSESIEKINSEILKQSHIAIDTEFMRERTYFAKLCLVQIATPSSIFCIDTISNDNLKEFWNCISNSSCIFHSARQDLEVIFQNSDLLPNKIFDTQIAAGLVGFEPQISYANLVEKLCGKVLKKSQTRANWEKRPLSKEMISYAREDVEFLLEMHAILLEKLKKLDRISWAEEDSKSLNNCNLYKFDSNEAINRIKSAKYLSGRTKKAIHLLLKWRENKAIEKNLPRQWIIRDKTLVNIASTSIDLSGDFSNIKDISERFIKKNGDEVIKILEKSRISAEDYPPENKMNEKQKKIMAEMQKFIVKISKSLNIAPEIIATKKEIKLYLMEKNKSKLIKGWRKKLTEEKFLELTE